MKSKMFLLLAILAISLPGFAQHVPTLEVKRNKIELPSFSSIRVDAQVNLVLYEGEGSHTATIEGHGNAADKVQLKVEDGTLVITTAGRKNYKKSVVVSIPVNDLQQISLDDDAMVVSVTTLRSNKIEVVVNSECWMKLRLTGQLNVKEGKGSGFGTVSYNDAAREYVFGDR